MRRRSPVRVRVWRRLLDVWQRSGQTVTVATSDGRQPVSWRAKTNVRKASSRNAARTLARSPWVRTRERAVVEGFLRSRTGLLGRWPSASAQAKARFTLAMAAARELTDQSG
jgi:hypothetical protein